MGGGGPGACVKHAVGPGIDKENAGGALPWVGLDFMQNFPGTKQKISRQADFTTPQRKLVWRPPYFATPNVRLCARARGPLIRGAAPIVKISSA